eukprot:gene26441-biopygen16477
MWRFLAPELSDCWVLPGKNGDYDLSGEEPWIRGLVERDRQFRFQLDSGRVLAPDLSDCCLVLPGGAKESRSDSFVLFLMVSLT